MHIGGGLAYRATCLVRGTGNADNNALRLAQLLLAHVGGLEGLTRATATEMEA